MLARSTCPRMPVLLDVMALQVAAMPGCGPARVGMAGALSLARSLPGGLLAPGEGVSGVVGSCGVRGTWTCEDAALGWPAVGLGVGAHTGCPLRVPRSGPRRGAWGRGLPGVPGGRLGCQGARRGRWGSRRRGRTARCVARSRAFMAQQDAQRAQARSPSFRGFPDRDARDRCGRDGHGHALSAGVGISEGAVFAERRVPALTWRHLASLLDV